MPELPEVETIASDLNSIVRGRNISGVWYDSPKQISVLLPQPIIRSGKIFDRINLVGRDSAKGKKIFQQNLADSKIINVSRRAKNVLFRLSGGRMLLIHPKKTGHLLVGKWRIASGRPIPISPPSVKEKINSYIHLILILDDGDMIGFSDARKFGKILLGSERAIMGSRDIKNLGPEPLEKEFDSAAFAKIVKSSKGRAKQFLLKQEKIAGIGNIYSDDILWLACINPLRRVGTLKKREIKNIFNAIKRILAKAVRLRGTSMSDYRDPSGETGGYMRHILVYGRHGAKCRRCGTEIKRIAVGGRSAHFCPRCQK